MEWKQIFGRARKTGTFSKDDLKTARSWPRCAVGNMLRSRGYNLSLTSRQLGKIIERYDINLEEMGIHFTMAISDSNYMPKCKQDYNSDENYRKQCMAYIDKAQKIYDRIQKTEPSKALINELELTVPPTSA